MPIRNPRYVNHVRRTIHIIGIFVAALICFTHTQSYAITISPSATTPTTSVVPIPTITLESEVEPEKPPVLRDIGALPTPDVSVSPLENVYEQINSQLNPQPNPIVNSPQQTPSTPSDTPISTPQQAPTTTAEQSTPDTSIPGVLSTQSMDAKEAVYATINEVPDGAKPSEMHLPKNNTTTNIFSGMMNAFVPTDTYLQKGFSPLVTVFLYTISAAMSIFGILLTLGHPLIVVRKLSSVLKFT